MTKTRTLEYSEGGEPRGPRRSVALAAGIGPDGRMRLVKRPTITVEQRRARLGRRHLLAAGHRVDDVTEAADRLVGLHATDPASIFLSARSRVVGLRVADVEAAMYEHRTLLKHLGMRRTVFVMPIEVVELVQAACTDTIAARLRRQLVKEVERADIASDGAKWLVQAERATLHTLTRLGEATGAQLSKATPALQAKFVYGEGKKWGGEVGVAVQVLSVLAAERKIVRGRPRGSWTSSQHTWTASTQETAPVWSAADATVELVRRWLRIFGPAPMSDIVWWTGLGVGKVRAALASIDMVEVVLEGPGGADEGIALRDDIEGSGASDEHQLASWVAVLPALDPTTMGWQRREWYLGAHAPALFDRNGNAGPTLWWNGQIVGGWAQRKTGEIVHRLLEDVGGEARRALEAELEQVERWLDGVVVAPRFATPLATELRSQ